jgi:3-methylcrotonyl-CoA carboxylase alpha subunit
MAKFKLAINHEEREFEATRQGNEIHISATGQTAVYHLIQHHNQPILLEQILPDGTRKQIRLAGHKEGDKRQLWLQPNGRTFTATRVRERGQTSQGNASLAAAIPAVVTAVLVNIGDTVAEGDKLILLESMKMVIPIQAPYGGVVAAVHCTQGDSVSAGVQLIEIEEVRNEK